MPKGKIHPNQPSQSLDTTTTEDPCKNGVRCGKWIFCSTKFRRGRGQHPSLKFEPTTPLSENRKRPAPSPASSANSVIGENSIPLLGTPIIMSTSGNQEYEDSSNDDDELMDLDFLKNMSESDEEDERIPQRVAPFTGMTGHKNYYVAFVGRNPSIYESWASCSKQVIKFKGAVHKKYSSWDEAYTAWVTQTRQVDQLVPPSLIPLLDDAARSSTEFTPKDRDGFPFTIIMALSLCFCVIVAAVMYFLLCYLTGNSTQ